MTQTPPPPSRPLRPEILVAQLAFTAAVAFAVGQQVLLAPTQPDFTTLWAAQQTTTPYDVASLNRILGSDGHWYAYPPTTLALTWPLKLFACEPAYLGWTILSACALVATLRSVFAPLLLAAPAVFLAAINGQTSLFMGALLLAAARLEARPILAGLLYGLAASLKPQVGLLIPVYLACAGHWRIVLAASATVAAVAGAATLLYGLQAWADWLAVLPSYVAANDGAWTHRYISLPGNWRVAVLIAGAIGALAAARRRDTELGLFICIGAALLGSLHAMDYDEAILAPFAFSCAQARRRAGLIFLVPLVFLPGRWPTLALTGLAAADLALRRSAPATPGQAGATIFPKIKTKSRK